MLKMDKLINQIHDAVIVTDINGCIIEWNTGAERQLGYSKNEVLGRPVYFLYPDTENTDFSQQQLISILKEKGELQFEAIMQKKSGEKIIVSTSLSPLIDKQATLIDQIHDAVIVTDLNGVITQWNKGAQQQLGYLSDEVIGRPVYFLYPETRENISQDEMISLLGENGTITFEAPMRKKSGAEILVHTSLSAITDSDNNVTGVISYTLDITEQRNAEKVRREKERIEHDLDIARHIQQSLLPSKPLITKNFQIAGLNYAADQTGGDYYDWLELPDGKIAISIADVSGHGIGPALIVAVCRAYFRASTRWQDDLNSVISYVNKLLTEDLTSGRFVTVAIGMLDMVNNKMEYYSAGHAPTFFYNARQHVVQQWGQMIRLWVSSKILQPTNQW